MKKAQQDANSWSPSKSYGRELEQSQRRVQRAQVVDGETVPVAPPSPLLQVPGPRSRTRQSCTDRSPSQDGVRRRRSKILRRTWADK